MLQKRIVAAVLAAVLLIPVFCVQAIAKTAVNSEQEGLLDALGLLEYIKTEDGGFDYEKAITRAEFIATVMRLKKFESKSTATAYFLDIKGHSYEAAINSAAEQGLVFGDGKGLFCPDEIVTLNGAMSILGRVLGYQQFELSQETTISSAYWSFLNGLGLLKAVSAEGTGLNGADVSVLLYNMLQAPISELESADNGTGFNYSKSDETFLNAYYDIYAAEGTLTATDKTGLNSADGVQEGMVQIDQTLYETAKDYTEQLGSLVKFYYQDDGADTRVIIYLAEQKQQMDIISISAEKIEGYVENTLSYYTDENYTRTRKADVAINANVIYNGRFTADVTDADFMPAYGTVKLVDKNRDGLYETAIITSKTYYVIERVTTAEAVIVDKYGKPNLNMEEEAEDEEKAIYFNGSSVDISYLQANDVLEVTASKDGKIIYATALTAKVKGTVTGIGTEELQIDGQNYKYNEAIVNMPELGKTGSFYLDARGWIVAYILEQTGLRYGYVIKAYVDDMEEHMILKILTSDGEIARYTTAEKVSYTDYNLTDKKTKQKGSDLYAFFTTEGITQRCLIMFDTNEDGTIRSIIRYKDNTVQDPATYPGYDKNVDFSKDAAMTDVRIYNMTNPGANYLIGANTKIFIVPRDGEKAEDLDYVAGNSSVLTSDMRNQTVEYYNSDESRTLGAMVIVQESGGNANYGNIVHNAALLIQETGEIVGDDGDIKFYARGYENGIEKTVIFSSDTLKSYDAGDYGFGSVLAKDLDFGDMIVYNLNTENEVKEFLPMMLWSAVKDTTPRRYFEGTNDGGGVSASNALANCHTLFGKVKDVRSNTIIVNAHDDAADNRWNRVYMQTATAVYKVDTARRVIEPVDEGDVMLGNEVFIRDRLYSMNLMIIYN